MPRSLPTPARLEALSDGVIAVILTIMVLELKVPRADGLPGFWSIVPTLLVYLLSFTFTGVYWVNHGHLVDRLKHVDHLVLWANLLFLFLLSLLPFFTEYVEEKHLGSFAVQLYALSLLIIAFSFQFLSASILRHTAKHAEMPVQQEKRQHLWEIRKGWFSVALYLSSVLLARWHPVGSLWLIAAVTLLWIVPDFGQKLPSAEQQEQQRS